MKTLSQKNAGLTVTTVKPVVCFRTNFVHPSICKTYYWQLKCRLSTMVNWLLYIMLPSGGKHRNMTNPGNNFIFSRIDDNQNRNLVRIKLYFNLITTDLKNATEGHPVVTSIHGFVPSDGGELVKKKSNDLRYPRKLITYSMENDLPTR